MLVMGTNRNGRPTAWNIRAKAAEANDNWVSRWLMFIMARPWMTKLKAMSQRGSTLFERIPETGSITMVATPPAVMASPASVAV